ncbi:hypothetical protein [Kitasatospora sp. NPDC056531]|uniref:hypothetical protein n=1 Tax=Kitasatospora sp. NPDC056531 TaxID=3345856 RepID=UPI0036B3710C
MPLVTQQHSAEVPADDPLLCYTITTAPDSLKASPENLQAPEETGEILIVASSRNGTPADVKSIRVKVPAGTMSPDLATDLAKVVPKISLSDWIVTLNTVAKEFVFTPTAEHATIGPDAGIAIQLAQIPINRKVGTAPITVTEKSRNGNSGFQDRSTAFNLGKFPAAHRVL